MNTYQENKEQEALETEQREADREQKETEISNWDEERELELDNIN